MKLTKTALNGVYTVEPEVFGDARGWFTETYNAAAFEKHGLFFNFVQDNQSFSEKKGTLRGLHFQNGAAAQAKLVRCTSGAILDVAVDMRKDSDTYLKHFSVELSAENKKQLVIPRGFAHGFLTLTDGAVVQYKADNLYDKDADRSVRWDDPSIGINWGVKEVILSDKDKNAPSAEDCGAAFIPRVLVTGAGGQLGYDVVRRFREGRCDVSGADITDFDITDYEASRRFILRLKPDIIVHCSAYTAVDKAETESETCRRINVTGSGNMARVAAEAGAKLVYVSTDYVFDGKGTKPFEVTDKTAPLNVYGRSKADGEQACAKHTDKLFVVRTSWVFGKNGNNFVKTMLGLASKMPEVSVVNDQIGSPTYTVDLADFIFFLSHSNKYGTYHFSNEEFCSWYEFAAEIFKATRTNVRLKAVRSSDYKTAAPRPSNSRLSKQSAYDAGYAKIPNWRDALKRYLKESD